LFKKKKVSQTDVERQCVCVCVWD